MSLVYLMYNPRTSVTGRALFEELKSRNTSGINLRRCNKRPPSSSPDYLIRWGNSLHDVGPNTVELNTQESVRNTTNKAAMLAILSEAEGVRIPDTAFNSGDISEFSASASGLRDSNGQFFVRDHNDHVRYDSRVRSTDKYVTRNVNKTQEYRIHVFNGNTVGVYEKIPEDSSVMIYKNENSTFRRLDQASRTDMESIRGARPMARAAVESLGLLFGGVDVLRTPDGQFVVTEVNTSPALNGPNLARFADTLLNYLTSLSSGEEQIAETEQSITATEQARLRIAEELAAATARDASRRALRGRIAEMAENEGFSIRALELI